MGAISILGQASCARSCNPIALKCFANSISHTSYTKLLLVASPGHLILHSTQTRQDSVAACTATATWEAPENEAALVTALVTHLSCGTLSGRWSSLVFCISTLHGEVPKGSRGCLQLSKVLLPCYLWFPRAKSFQIIWK